MRLTSLAVEDRCNKRRERYHEGQLFVKRHYTSPLPFRKEAGSVGTSMVSRSPWKFKPACFWQAFSFITSMHDSRILSTIITWSQKFFQKPSNPIDKRHAGC